MADSMNAKLVDALFDLSREVGSLVGEVRSVVRRLEKGDEKLADHEARISTLEQRGRIASPSPSWSFGKLNSNNLPWVVVAIMAIIIAGILGIDLSLLKPSLGAQL